MPLVSVIVPVYKVEKVLHYCIDSILAQTFADFELILINDGSPDDSGKICDRYASKDERIKVFHNSNHGVSYTRNYGVKLAQGKYICFIDSDDYVQPDYLELLLKAKAENPDFDNIWCCLSFVKDYNETIIRDYCYSKDEPYSYLTYRIPVTLNEKVFVASPCNKLYSKSIIVNNRLFMNDEISLGEDLIFNLEYLDCTDGKIVVYNDTKYNYLVGVEDTLTTKYYENLCDIFLRLYNTWDFYLKKWQAEPKEIQKNIDSMIGSYARIFTNTFNSKNHDSFFKKLKYNKSIMLSDNYQFVVENCTLNLEGFYRLAYRFKSPLMMYCYYKYKELKEKLYRFIKK